MDDAIAATEIELRGRARVVQQARELFLAQGYAAVSMQQIADAVGVNKATLYHYFRDKQALFIAVMVDQGKQMAVAIGAALAAGKTLEEKLALVAQCVLDMQHSDFGRLSSDLHLHVSEEGRAQVYAQSGVPWALLSADLEAAMARGDIREIDPDMVGRLFFGMIISQRWRQSSGPGDREPVANLAQILADILLHGIASDSGQEPRVTPASGDDLPQTPA